METTTDYCLTAESTVEMMMLAVKAKLIEQSTMVEHLLCHRQADHKQLRLLRGMLDVDTLDEIEVKQQLLRDRAILASVATTRTAKCGLSSAQEFRDHAVPVPASELLAGLTFVPVPCKTGSVGYGCYAKPEFTLPNDTKIRLQVSMTVVVIGSNTLSDCEMVTKAWFADRAASKEAKKLAKEAS